MMCVGMAQTAKFEQIVHFQNRSTFNDSRAFGTHVSSTRRKLRVALSARLQIKLYDRINNMCGQEQKEP